MADKLAITSLLQAFAMIKQMNPSAGGWKSDYRVAGRREVKGILEGVDAGLD